MARRGERHLDWDYPLWLKWIGMKQRCGNPKTIGYKNYGGRGIDICIAWKESYQMFKNWALQSGYAANLNLDRIDNNGDYSPENCRFVTPSENSRNRRNNIKITVNNVTKTLIEWAETSGLKYGTLQTRRKHNWPAELFLAPVGTKYKSRWQRRDEENDKHAL